MNRFRVGTDCCNAPVQCWERQDGAREGWCRECSEQTCSSCAGSWDEEMDDGHVHTVAFCADCWRMRETA